MFVEQHDIDRLARILEQTGLELILVPDGETPYESGFHRIGDLDLPPEFPPPIITPGKELWIRRTGADGAVY